MTGRRLWLTAALVATIAFASGAGAITIFNHSAEARNSATPAQSMGARWECKAITAPTHATLADQANELGKEGWEITSVLFSTERNAGNRYIAYLKRLRQ